MFVRLTAALAGFAALGFSRGGVPTARLIVALVSVASVGCSEDATLPATGRAWLPDEPSARFPAGEPVIEWAASIAADGDEIVVGDRMAGVVRRYSSTGALLGSFGRRGDGPDEFSALQRIEVDPAGLVWVADQARSGIVAFDRRGARLEARPGGYIPISFAPLSAERVVVVSAFDDLGLLALGAEGAVEPFFVEGPLGDLVASEPPQRRAVRFTLVPVDGTHFYIVDQDRLSAWLVEARDDAPAVATEIAGPVDVVEPAIAEREDMLRALPVGQMRYALLSDAWDADSGGRLLLKLATGPLLALYVPDRGWMAIESSVYPREGLVDVELLGNRLALLYETEVLIVRLPDGLPPQADLPNP